LNFAETTKLNFIFRTLGTFGDFYDYTCVAIDQLQLLAFSKQDLADLAIIFPDDVRYMREVLRRVC
jgi:hypothetical protein